MAKLGMLLDKEGTYFKLNDLVGLPRLRAGIEKFYGVSNINAQFLVFKVENYYLNLKNPSFACQLVCSYNGKTCCPYVSFEELPVLELKAYTPN